MNIVLWIFAGLLAAMFLMAGVMKVAMPKEKLLPIDEVGADLVGSAAAGAWHG